MNNNSYKDRIRRNNEYYDAFSSEVKVRSGDRDFGAAFDRFLSVLPTDGKVLDVGCGAGNHLAIFKSKGIHCIGVEPSSQMRILASEEGEVVEGSFETLDQLKFERIGGVWAAASLLHVPENKISEVFDTIALSLPVNGPFYFTVRLGEGSKWDQWNDSKGDVSRFLQLFSENELVEKLADANFKITYKWTEDSYWGRPSKWLSVVAQKS